MTSMRKHLFPVMASLIAAVLLAPQLAAAQQFFNQEAVAEILTHRRTSLDEVPEVYYDYYVFGKQHENSVRARGRLYETLGEGDQRLGKERSRLVQLLNRRLLLNLERGDTLVVPTMFERDFRAYAPFPRYYPGARSYDKLFIIHKGVQAWAAYESGKLARWGVVNTGDPKKTATPSGRFNFNWKQEYRVSTLSPPGEDWEMYWVFNFHHARGIHVHQYPFPSGGPTSHGCVRLIDADAKWVYQWAESWKTTEGHIGPWSAQGRILEQGTTVLVLGAEPEGVPRPFTFERRHPVLKRLDLPGRPSDVPPGTPQQRRFDHLSTAR